MNQLEKLKPRERQVCVGFLAGLSTKEIAARINRDDNTVQFHWTAIRRKFGLARREDIVLALCLGRVP